MSIFRSMLMTRDTKSVINTVDEVEGGFAEWLMMSLVDWVLRCVTFG